MSDLAIDFAGVTPDSLARECQAAIDRCDDAITEIVDIDDSARTFANTMLALEEATDNIAQASGQQAFLAYVAADDDLRAAAHEWEAQLDKYAVGLSFREDVYGAVRAFADMPEADALTGEAKRLVEHTLRDYRRSGFGLPAEDRGRVRELFDRLVELGITFRQHIDEWEDGITVSRDELDGLPDSYIEGLETVEEAGEQRYRVTLDYPDIFPFLSNAKSEARRRELFEKDQRKGGAPNVALLEEAIAVRTEVATLLGYDSWASYTVETRMARDRKRVTEFLADLQQRVAKKAAIDMELLREAKARAGGTGDVNIWDWRFCTNELLRTKYAVDEFAVAEYFPLDACIDGLFAAMQSVLGVRFTPATDGTAWHPDVQGYDITEAEGGEPFARFYMDLFPRPNKFGHAAAFTLRQGRRRADGTYQKPISAIVANFTKPTASQPSLLRHSEVVTLFHEFGHIMHQTLTRAEHSRFSGTATERDFVEAPSQMLEHWVWEPEVLRTFARHHRTGEPIPAELVDAMIAAKNVSSGISTLRQLYFANLDFAYHSPGFGGDTTQVAADLHPLTGFPFTDDTHFQSGFGHLFGYDAGYYGYLWSHVFGDDMYTRFEEAGALDTGTGQRYRLTILERGGAVDGDELVRSFLGREPNNAAFLRGLGLDA